MNRLLVLPLLLVLAGCAAQAPRPAPAPADAFLAYLRVLCGKAYAGRVVSSDPADAEMARQPLVMHVRECGTDSVRIPFHVGADRSRTWVLSRTASGLRLKHDHRHEDGTPDAMTMYGGDTIAAGSAVRQEFPADAESRELFVREGRAAAVDNVWSMKIVPGASFAYELRRPERHFRVEFDLTQPVPLPPAPWGH